jgi:hypothetical protein
MRALTENPVPQSGAVVHLVSSHCEPPSSEKIIALVDSCYLFFATWGSEHCFTPVFMYGVSSELDVAPVSWASS